ncbi:efflux RND transporter permease subunit [Pseudovibrio sp. Tun.PSC04-5.I4]|uniref:efflux RND transporter permease subunit n=1 Tax=Pseudovibrio sp. Tun.PSC04-5.I4 TaxID=1798213 RepID=UPI00088576F9|nr:efflux RND transporter permease subunit [Pseudovibrio sp. Tun.PSC04-5.I4]SDQ32429.1 Multidrug efflux pump subunit AcrB [Pseudovibrio sp. Tun.PSC04-5.I4]
MKSLTTWFIRNPVAANLIMAFILIVGVTSLMTVRIEGFPKLPADTITITTTLPNAYTAQVDQQITRKIEKALEGLAGVKNISSSTQPGVSLISVEKNSGYNLQTLLDDIRLKVDSIYNLPKKAERPVIERNDFDMAAMFVQVYGDTDLKTLQTLARKLRNQLLSNPEVSRLKEWGLQNEEVRIGLKPYTLERLNLTISDVMKKIRESSLYFQSGTLKTEGGFISLRADSQAFYKSEFENIPIVQWEDGTATILGDIATISDDFAELETEARFNSQKSIGLEILIGRKDNLITVSGEVKKLISEFEQTLPRGVKVEIFGNSSDYIEARLSLLSSNAVQGLLLVLLLLSLFLNLKLAFWVAMGIPISLAGAFAIGTTGWVDYSLNDITTFGLIIALGILVDDAVIVGESIFEQRKHYKNPLKGTEAGVNKVAVATVFGVLTTIAAFFPMLLMSSPLGKILGSFSGIVILALLFSLFESKFILPAHLAYISLDEGKSKYLPARIWAKIQGVARGGLFWFRDTVYKPTVSFAIKQRYAVLVAFIAVAALVMGLMWKGKIHSVFFPDIPGQYIVVNLKMDPRAPLELTRSNIAVIEETTHTIDQTYAEKQPEIGGVFQGLFRVLNDKSSAVIYAELRPVAERGDVQTADIMRAWRKLVGPLEGVSKLTFSGFGEVGGGFKLRLFAEDPEQLRLASEELQVALAIHRGVSNVRDTFTAGQPEMRLTLKPEARHLGFTPERLATQVGYQFGGGEAQRLQRGSSEVRVIVQNVLDARNTIEDLLQTRLQSSNGDWITLQSVANVEARYVSGFLYRLNGDQVATIEADINKQVIAPAKLGQDIFENVVPQLQLEYPGVKFRQGGELEEMGEVKSGVIRAMIITCFLIYTLLAIPLKSYFKPLIIMSVVPFGFVGAVIGHAIMGIPFSMMSIFGLLALIGVVVNDSLVMVTHYRHLREDGVDHLAATDRSGMDRFQAIFLTTATTVVGLIPLMNETSEQAMYLIPAAVSLAYGEVFGTLITLILIPVLIAIAEDIRVFFFGEHDKTLGYALIEHKEELGVEPPKQN